MGRNKELNAIKYNQNQIRPNAASLLFYCAILLYTTCATVKFVYIKINYMEIDAETKIK